MLNSSSRRLEGWVSVANVHREFKETMRKITIEDEVRECFYKLQGFSSSSYFAV